MRRAAWAVAVAGGLLAAAVPVLGGDGEPAPDVPVSAAEARAAVARVVALTADGAFDQVCREASAECAGLSSGPLAGGSRYAPGPDRPPTVRCTFALPAHLRGTAWGDGHVVVLAGRDAQDRPYVSQQLVVREDGVARVHEPAFWLGVAYGGFGGVRGSTWSSAWAEGDTDPAEVRRQTARAESSCTDTAAYLAAVAPTG